jgi:K+-sensing histidine kinase KdpD
MGKYLPFSRYATALLLQAGAIAGLTLVRHTINLTAIAALLLVALISIATWAGRGPALLASIMAAISLNYFFIPPLHTFHIRESQDWIAFGAFVVSALTVGQLSSWAQAKAEQAEARRVKIEELYRQLQAAFEQASEAETLRRSEKLRAALLDAVTHDLRTPLTSIKASVTALMDHSDEQSPTESKIGESEFLQVINEETDRLNRFVEEMMSLAKIEGGHLLLHSSATSADDIVTAVLQRVDHRLRDTEVEVDLQDNLPLLLVDASVMSQALYEIMENAAKYSKKGGGPIQISAARVSAGMVEIIVDNEGTPVPSDLRQHVFEKLFRVPGTSKKEKGFGMGLAIAKGIVEAHGGTIAMEESRIRQGTVVRFTVPSQP